MSASDDPVIFTFSLAYKQTTGGTYENFFTVFMHDTSYISRRYYFILDPMHPNVSYNRITRYFSEADPDKKIEHINDYTFRDSLTYVQHLNGVFTKIVFPGLDSVRQKLQQGKFSINKARLSVPAYLDGDQFTLLTVPSSLVLRYEDKDGNKFDVPDYNLDTNHEFFDGTFHKADSTYYFNIPTYIQQYLEDKNNDYKPELEIYLGPNVLKSVILRANENKIPVKFEMTYTRF